MKKLFLISAILGIVALASNRAVAQVNVNLNIGTQPAWVPSGYESVNYYYLPEVQSYYYVPQRQYVYYSGNRWIRSRYLPNRYRGYNMSHVRKVVVYGNSPYRSYNIHRVRYAPTRLNYGRPDHFRPRIVRYSAPRPYRSYNAHYDNRGHGKNINTSLFSSRHRGRR